MTESFFYATSIDLGVSRTLNALDKALDDSSLMFWMQTEAKRHVDERSRNRFQSEGDDVSGRWAPLAPQTIIDRIQRGYGAGPILHRTGALEAYITENPGTITADPSGVRLETPSPTGDSELSAKFLTAQSGSGKVPQRIVVGLNEIDAETLLTSLTISLTAAIEGHLI